MPNIKIIIGTIGHALTEILPRHAGEALLADYKAFVTDPSGTAKKGGIYFNTGNNEVVLYFPQIAYMKGTPQP